MNVGPIRQYSDKETSVDKKKETISAYPSAILLEGFMQRFANVIYVLKMFLMNVAS